MVAPSSIAGEPRLVRDENTGEEWLVVDNVPIFDEHTDEDGVQYDRRLLAQVANNNNQRIADTGDYVPIVLHHTPEDGDPDKDPEVVGMAGPFRMGKLGKKKPRYCILATFRLDPKKRNKFKDRNRRSVEVWPEDCPENRYLDPIALLGAETPRRDLGIVRYSQRAQTHYRKSSKAYRYEMSSVPGPYSTLPNEKIRNQRSGQMTEPLSASPQTIQQIIDGMLPVIDQRIEERLSDTIGGDLSPVDVPDDNPVEGADMPVDELPIEESLGTPGGDDALEETPAPMSDDDKQYARMTYQRKVYSKGDDTDAAMAAMDELGDDRDLVEQYMKAAEDDDEMAVHYRKCCGLGEDEMHTKDRYSKRYNKVLKDNQQLRAKYAKLNQESVQLKAKYRKLQSDNRRLTYQKDLTDRLMEGYIFDIDEELDRVMQMDDPVARDYIDSTIPRFGQAPIGSLPISEMSEQPKAYAKLKEDQEKTKERSLKARKAVERYRKTRPNLQFKEVYDWMEENDSYDYDPEKHLQATG